jgi:hypothetical protein
MTEFYGKDLVFTWNAPGGSVNMSEYQRGVSFSPSAQLDDNTTGSAGYRTKSVGLKDFTVTYKGLQQASGTSGGTTLEDALQAGASGTIVFQPEGTAVGTRKYTFLAISQGLQVNQVYDALSELNVTFDGNGTITYGAST